MSASLDRHPGHIGRPPLRPTVVYDSLRALAVAIAALGLGASVALAATHTHYLSYLVGGVAGVAILSILFVIPLRTLPGVTLLVTLLIPTNTTVLPHTLQGAALGVIPLTIWLIRAPARERAPTVLRTLAALLGIWLVLCEIYAPLHTHHGWEWFFTATMTLVFAVLATPTGLTPKSFRTLFLAVTTVLGLYAVLEGFVLHHNVLFGALFEHDSWWITVQHNVSYRVTTLLGHPLINGTIFSAAAVLAATNLIQGSTRPRLALAQLVILIAATAGTHSRGAAIALGLGLVTVIAFGRSSKKGANARRLALIVAAILGGVFLLGALKARDESQGGQSSAAIRVTVIERASETLRSLEPFGAGPGESEEYRIVHQLPGWQLDLENSYAELAVSIGLGGLALVIVLLSSIVIFGFRHLNAIGEAAALLTMILDIAGFNAIEDHKPIMVIIGLFVISIITASRQRPSAQTDVRHNRLPATVTSGARPSNQPLDRRAFVHT